MHAIDMESISSQASLINEEGSETIETVAQEKDLGEEGSRVGIE